VGSASGASTVTSYSQNNEGTSIFLSSDLIMNIQSLSPAFDVIRQPLCLIEIYQNNMTFW
jgi:hypothetical protein